jgi:hypothetical protein
MRTISNGKHLIKGGLGYNLPLPINAKHPIFVLDRVEDASVYRGQVHMLVHKNGMGCVFH